MISTNNSEIKTGSTSTSVERILWVMDLLEANTLGSIFQLKTPRDIADYKITDDTVSCHHYIYDKGMDEGIIKGIGWTVKNNCRVFHQESNLPIYNLSTHELGELIPTDSIPFEKWLPYINHKTNKLEYEDAINLAKLATRLLNGTLKRTELNNLRIRCGERAIDWRDDMKELEREFQQELKSRGITDPKLNRVEKAKLEILALVKEKDSTTLKFALNDISVRYNLPLNDVKELLRQSIVKIKTPTFELEDIETISYESSKIDWLVPKFLPKGETLIVAGSPKDGKSLLAIDLAFCIATGENTFLGNQLERGKVFIICPDASKKALDLQLYTRGFRPEDKGWLKRSNSFDISQIDELIEKIENEDNLSLVILDSLHSITTSAKISENSAEFGHIVISIRQAIARSKSKASAIIIHHVNKSLDSQGVNRLRGSSAIASDVWGIATLNRILNKGKIDITDSRRELEVISRNSECYKTLIDLNFENCSWYCLEEEKDKNKIVYREQIINLLKNHPIGLIGKDIATNLDLPVKSIYSELTDMIGKNLIKSKPHSKDKRKIVYFLEQSENISTPPLPSLLPFRPDYNAVTHTQQALENSQVNSQVDEKISQVENCSDNLKESPDNHNNPTAILPAIVRSNNLNKGGGV